MRKISKAIIAIAIPVIMVCLILFFVKVANVNAIYPTDKSEDKKEVLVGEAIEIGKQDVPVAESNGKILYVNPKDLNLIVEDAATGIRWMAVNPDGSDKEKSLLTITYVGEDNTFEEWDAYTYCVVNESYELYQIENGVRMVLTIAEGASQRFYEYMPQKMSMAHYEEVFLGGLEQLVEDGTLEKAQATKYKSTLSLIYKKSKETESYNVNFVGQPPKSAVTQLIELSQLVGYTTEMLLADAEEFDFEVEFEEPAVFTITLDATLENGELVVNLPVKEIINGNDYYLLQNVEVLTNFGLVAAETVEEGYFLIPDGSGALMKLNTYDPKVSDYLRGFYDNDYYTDYYYMPEYAEELLMPVFGMLYLNGTSLPYGFLSIIESGADTAYLEAQLASGGADGVGRLYNKIYTTYDVSQYKWVRVFGEYNSNTSTYLSFAPETEQDYTLRYLFYTGDEVSYYQMAKDYQNYLCGGEKANVYAERAELFLEAIGTLSLEERILGIPYNTEYSMTTYSELSEILADLGDRHVNVAYRGAFDGGMNHKLMNQGSLVKTNGTESELKALQEQLETDDSTLFMETDFLKIYNKSGNGFVKSLHALQNYSKEAVEVYGYTVAQGRFVSDSNVYYMLSPRYLLDTVQDFKANVTGTYHYYVTDLAEHYYADYGNHYMSPYDAQQLADKALTVLAEGSELALDNPRTDKLANGAIAVNVSRESSELSLFYTSIPFKQLVLNGMLEYTTKSANNSSDAFHYYLMQAVETGAQPKFTISAKSVDVLKGSKYSSYYSIQYDLLKEEIKEVYDAYAEAMELIQKAEIINHTMLAQDVFLTEYANGTQVVTNYTFRTFTYNGTEVAGNDYLILKGGN